MIKPPLTAAAFFHLFFFFVQLSLTVRVTSSYISDELFGVNCGNSGNIPSVDQRKWTGDIGSTLFSLIDRHASTISVKVDTPVKRTVPYGAARLSRSEFSYSFPVTKGRKFVRLYFYPYSYIHNFLRSDSLFSVEAGSFTLLKDFNASLAADDAAQETISREFCVYVEQGQTLKVTFLPNLSHPNAYAFVNGIEVVSMPSNLYYTSPEDLRSFRRKDGPRQFPYEDNSFLESMYRINVGGRQIPPEDDTGMFRMWDPDNSYLEIERSQSVSAAFGLNLNHSDDQDYFAPDEVYKTARNYGMKEKFRFNVTWEFQVDSKFFYYVRLHFCEFDGTVENIGERVFHIFIDDHLVENYADVLQWSGNQLIPIHWDYAVWMQSIGNEQKLNLSIKLQPLPTVTRSARNSTYRDVLLNGLEIFKISDNPRSSPSLISSSLSQKNARRVISISVGVAAGFVILFLIACLIYWRQKTATKSKASKTPGTSLVPSDLCRCFSIKEIRAITNNFDDTFVVGVGGFGNVYKGYIDNSPVPVAIKRLKKGSQQGLHEFETEIEMLSQLRHNHLVSLIGFCTGGNEMILVYEFIARGTLRDHLYDSNQPPLSWHQRLEICLGAARGLHYLHTGAKHTIIHRDIKSTNILIDENWMAKISDFGLSKIGPSGITRSNINISTAVKGSIGYLDPEYYTRHILTEKSDVYSFGVVLLEVLCGRPPILRAVERQKQNLVEWFRRCVDENETYDTVDPFIRESITPECLYAYIDIALQCLADDGNERPSMGDVMLGLESVMEILHKAGKTKLGGTLNEEITFDEGSVVNG
ncbi:hypothetical protein K1719_042594 [Acacia pycnantha]|nr:hypothetical protein K1719_042594 [Acacia pycnantha]